MKIYQGTIRKEALRRMLRGGWKMQVKGWKLFEFFLSFMIHIAEIRRGLGKEQTGDRMSR